MRSVQSLAVNTEPLFESIRSAKKLRTRIELHEAAAAEGEHDIGRFFESDQRHR
jgi:hypothetical protein